MAEQDEEKTPEQIAEAIKAQVAKITAQKAQSSGDEDRPAEKTKPQNQDGKGNNENRSQRNKGGGDPNQQNKQNPQNQGGGDKGQQNPQKNPGGGVSTRPKTSQRNVAVMNFKRAVWTLGAILTAIAVMPFIRFLFGILPGDLLAPRVLNLIWPIPVAPWFIQFCMGALIALPSQLLLTVMQNRASTANQRAAWRGLDAAANFASIRSLLRVLRAINDTIGITFLLAYPIVAVVNTSLDGQWANDGVEAAAVALGINVLLSMLEMLILSWWVAAYPEA